MRVRAPSSAYKKKIVKNINLIYKKFNIKNIVSVNFLFIKDTSEMIPILPYSNVNENQMIIFYQNFKILGIKIKTFK